MIFAGVHDDGSDNVIEKKRIKAIASSEIPETDGVIGGSGRHAGQTEGATSNVEIRHRERMARPSVEERLLLLLLLGIV